MLFTQTLWLWLTLQVVVFELHLFNLRLFNLRQFNYVYLHAQTLTPV